MYVVFAEELEGLARIGVNTVPTLEERSTGSPAGAVSPTASWPSREAGRWK